MSHHLTPWDHQIEGARLIEDQSATYLFWEMGTGKTRAIIDYIADYRPKRTLVVSPKSVMSVWTREFMKHRPEADVMVQALDGTTMAKKMKQAHDAWTKADVAKVPLVLVGNYDSMWRKPLADSLQNPLWDLVVLDEIHRIKSPTGRASLWFSKLSGRAKKRVGLSGTMIPHSPLDLFGQFRFLDIDLFGKSFYSFKSRYAIMGGFRGPDGRPKQVTGWREQEDMNRRIYKITHRVKTTDVHELPDVHHIIRSVKLPPKALKQYKELEKQLIADLGGGAIIAVANALSKVGKLQQIASGFVMGGEDAATNAKLAPINLHNEKIKSIDDILTDLPEPVAVFCKYRHTIDRIGEHVTGKLGRPVDYLYGGRNDIGAKWEWDGVGPPPVAIIQLQSGCEGIDLTLCRVNILAEEDWSLGRYDQLLKRTHRYGQTKKVTYYHICGEGTVDETIANALIKRRADARAILDLIRSK